jgi:hypothetical protein
MISAETIALLVDAGLSGETLKAVVRSIEADNAPKRSDNAERQARHRAKKKEEEASVTRNVTNNVTECVTDPSPLVPPLSPAPLSPPIIPPTRKTQRATLVPENWFPSAKLVKLAYSLGFTEPELQDQFERMRDWSHGNNEARSDWDAAFRNWLKRAADDRKAKNANTRKPNTIADGFDLIDRAIEDQERRLAQAEEWPGRSEDDPVSISRLRQSAA